VGAKYTHNYAAFGEAVLRAPWMKDVMVAKANEIMARAIALSPTRTGRYKASFKVTSGIKHGATSRAYGRVTNTAPYAAAVEFGFGKTPRHRPLGRAIGG
jgi:hypothetical protein